MKRFFLFNEFDKILEYDIIDEGEKMTKNVTSNTNSMEKAAKQQSADKKDSIYPKKEDKKTGEKKLDKSAIPKDALVKGLAKELYTAQVKALTLQNDIDKVIDELTNVNPDDPNIAVITASGALQVANAQLRADTIEMQMVAAAGDNAKLGLLAAELAAEAKNLAMKKGLDIFDKKLKKIKDNLGDKKEAPKEE